MEKVAERFAEDLTSKEVSNSHVEHSGLRISGHSLLAVSILLYIWVSGFFDLTFLGLTRMDSQAVFPTYGDGNSRAYSVYC